MKKIFLIAGHHRSDPGAVTQHKIYGTVKEADLTIELRDLVLSALMSHNPGLNVWVDNDGHQLSVVISEVRSNCSQGDIVIDIHFNAVENPNATGAEVIVSDHCSISVFNKAAAVSKKIADTLRIPNRGAKKEKETARKKIGILYGVGDRYLLEVCFISNPNDLEKYQKNKHVLVDEIVNLIERLL